MAEIDHVGQTHRVAQQLQVAESTLSRWETGVQIQQRCMDRLLRAYFAVAELRAYLEKADITRELEAPVG